LKQLAEQAGHPLDLTKVHPTGWIDASREAQRAGYDLMAQMIDDALRSSKSQE
jgi:cell filamentation protein